MEGPPPWQTSAWFFPQVVWCICCQVVSRQYLGGGGLHISFWLVCRSVLIYLGAPLLAAVATRALGVALKGREWYDTRLAPRLGPIALLALLYTIWIMFALQGHEVRRPKEPPNPVPACMWCWHS